MRINLDENFDDGGRWFDVDDDVRVRVRFLPREKLRAIIAKHTRTLRNGTEQTDFAKVNLDVFDHAVTEWEGIEMGGAPAPCTRENKERLINVDYKVFRFVDAIVTDREEFARGKDLEKNSGASSGSS